MSFIHAQQWGLDAGLIIDNFAGGGGASTGIEMALNRPVSIAINHDREAIKMHEANHPHTRHLCEDVFEVDPVEVCKGRRVDLAWFSPDCTHHSKAKGGKPRSKKIRGLAWVVLRWASAVKPTVIMLENVEEFEDWGPLTKDGKPCKKRKGETFRLWVSQLEALGYVVEFRQIRACIFGTPTIRKRLYVIARCDGQDIVWPEATHGDPKSEDVKKKRLKPWGVAADIIDWSLPCPSIFLDQDEARALGLRVKRPLKENTLSRIYRGMVKFVFNATKPFIVTVNHAGENFRGQDINDPMKTITSAYDATGLVMPYVQHVQHSSKPNGTMPADEPLRTITAHPKGGGFALTTAQIEPTDGDLQAAFMAQHNNTSADSRSVEEPVSTITQTGSQQGVVAAHLTKFRNGAIGTDMNEPVPTITANSTQKKPGGAAPIGLVMAHLDRQFGNSDGGDIDEPVGTITAGGGGKTALCASFLTKMRGTCKHGQATDEPTPTITAGGTHLAECRAFLLKYYGTAVGQDMREPLDTVTSRDRFGLIVIKGILYQIVDIGMRMLTPRELFAAMGFPPDYKIGDRESDGFTLTKHQQVAKCGNAVCPPVAAALVRANVPQTALLSPAMEKSA